MEHFTPEHAEMALNLSFRFQTAEEIISKARSTLGSIQYKASSKRTTAVEMLDEEEESWNEFKIQAKKSNIKDLTSYFSSLGQSRERSSLAKRKSNIKTKKKSSC